jgi:histidyl-tRNA synthetase
MEINPLRVLDSKVDGPKLTDAPKMKDFLCAECVAHHHQFLSLIRSSIKNVEENPRLVRGLDYYNRSVFEFVSPDLGAQSALAAGGRYDGLVEQLGGPSVPGVGFALGMDRVVSVLLQKNKDAAKASPQKTAVVIPMMDEAVAQAFEIAAQLRQNGVCVPPIQPKKKLKNQLSLAVDIGANWAILIGEDEMKAGSVTVKDLSNRTQTLVSKIRLIDALK